MVELKWEEAIKRVLAKAHPEPLHYVTIAERIIEDGLRQSLGATPDVSVNVTIGNALRKAKEGGPASAFVRVSSGVYGLRDAPKEPVENGVKTATGAENAPASDTDESEDLGIVTSLGMFWRRDLADLTTPMLLGQKMKGATPVDFSDQRGVYVLLDRDRAIYVGRSTDRGFGVRLNEHTFDRLAGRWDRFSWFGVRAVSDSGSLGEYPSTKQRRHGEGELICMMEAILIETLEPPLNRKRGNDFRAVEYLQIPAPGTR